MRKQLITYTNFNGIEVSDEFCFNLTKTEVIEMELGESFSRALSLISEGSSPALIIRTFHRILEAAYGVISEDGSKFRKSKEAWLEFKQSAAYDAFFMRFVTDAKMAGEFISGIMPADLDEFVAKAEKNRATETRTLPIENVHTGAAGNVFDNSPEVNKLTIDELRAEIQKRSEELKDNSDVSLPPYSD